MADDHNDNFLKGLANETGIGHDVLFGWLIGRAAEGLELAKTISTHDAGQSRQLQQLEASLLEQLRRLLSPPGSANAGAEKMATPPEPAATVKLPAAQIDVLQAALTTFEKRLAEPHNQFENRYLSIEELGENIGARVRDLGKESSARAGGGESRPALDELRRQLQSLSERVGRIENSAAQSGGVGSGEVERLGQSMHHPHAELRDDFQRLSRRVDDAESGTPQAPARQSQLDEPEMRTTADHAQQIREWEKTLADKILLLERHEREIERLKAEVRFLGDRQKPAGVTARPPDVSTDTLRASGRVAADVAENGVGPAGSGAAVEPADVQVASSFASANLSAAEDSLSRLQARMMADIRRARAQLKAKSGRGKADH